MEFDRLRLILSDEKLNAIWNTKVLIIGIGGVGGMTLECLTRYGVKNITIIDNDVVDITNLNRQIISLHSNVGLPKVSVAKKRCEEIFPKINVNALNVFLNESNIYEILNNDYDYIIDACDTVSTKLELIKYSQKNNIKLITCLGTGNRFNPCDLCITTLSKTENDPLARILRKLVKGNNLSMKQLVVWSKEIPLNIHDRTPGSNSIVPNAAGILLASYVINDIIKK